MPPKFSTVNFQPTRHFEALRMHTNQIKVRRNKVVTIFTGGHALISLVPRLPTLYYASLGTKLLLCRIFYISVHQQLILATTVPVLEGEFPTLNQVYLARRKGACRP